MPWTLHPAARFADFMSAWDRLNERADGPAFLDAMFVARALSLLGSGAEWVATRGRPGCEDAMCILRAARPGVFQTFQPSQLPLGAWLMLPGMEFPEVVPGLFARLPGLPLLVGISQQDPALHRRPQPGKTIETLHYVETGWIDIDRTFPAYWRERGAHLRQNVRTQMSKLASLRIKPVVEEITEARDVAAAIEEYGRLESAGWKSACGTALDATNIQGRFYRAVMEDYCRIGAGRIFRLKFGERTVAIDLCIESRGRHVLLKTTYDETMKGFSPSTLLKHRVYERVFERSDLRRIEFFARYVEWMSRWTGNVRSLYHVNAFRWRYIRAMRDRMRPVVLRQPRIAGSRTVSRRT